MAEDLKLGEKGKSRFVSRTELARRLKLPVATLERARKLFPVQWPRYYLELVGSEPEKDPIARMGRPDESEWQLSDGDLADPVADLAMRPVPFLVRKHQDRVILLTTKKCHFYCRFCFRREEPVAKLMEPQPEDWARIEAYLHANPEIHELILSGGDPLTLSNQALFALLTRLQAVPSVTHFRIHTRAPIHFPERVDSALLDGLRCFKPLRIMTHANHARELTEQTRRIAVGCADRELGLWNQSVLLAGVNDQLEAQLALWQGVVALGIKPYYLHHPDRASGNQRFRVTIARGRALYLALRDVLGENAPRYVLDLPDGRGKVPVLDFVRQAEGYYLYQHPDGSISEYRDWE